MKKEEVVRSAIGEGVREMVGYKSFRLGNAIYLPNVIRPKLADLYLPHNHCLARLDDVPDHL